MKRARIRIAGGSLRRKVLPPPPGAGTRPLLARIRKSLFDILAPELRNARVLDAFAGSGSFGLEAVSRGAAAAVLVELSPPACAGLKAAASSLGVADRVTVVCAEAETALVRLAGEGARFRVVFLDPPFAMDRGPELLRGAAGVLEPGGVAVLRLPAHRRFPPGGDGWALVRHNRYGISAVGFYRRRGEDA